MTSKPAKCRSTNPVLNSLSNKMSQRIDYSFPPNIKKPSTAQNTRSLVGGRHPAVMVTWYEAVAFCHRLSRCGAREGALRGSDYRLPTEAEWEYACRAATTTPFHFGPTISTDAANYNGAFVYGAGSAGVYRHESTEVGSFPANAWGLADMHGNVWEWCSDAWHADYVGAPADGCAWDNPVKGMARVARGGSWHEPPEICRSATRLKASPAYGDDLIGFRVAL